VLYRIGRRALARPAANGLRRWHENQPGGDAPESLGGRYVQDARAAPPATANVHREKAREGGEMSQPRGDISPGELDRLVLAQLNGSISAEEHQRLEALLESRSEARADYLQHIHEATVMRHVLHRENPKP